jgi:hypothetical protein
LKESIPKKELKGEENEKVFLDKSSGVGNPEYGRCGVWQHANT